MDARRVFGASLSDNGVMGGTPVPTFPFFGALALLPGCGGRGGDGGGGGVTLSVYNAIKEKQHGVHVIQGGPGCGKSFLIAFLHRYFHSISKNVVLCASTAIAAINIRGQTIDRIVALDMVNQKGINIPPLKPAYQLCRNADVIIVDEAFMLEALKLDVCLKRILNCGDTSPDEQMMKKLFILVGDANQLPPVCKHKNKSADQELLPTCTKCNILNSEFRRYGWNIHNLSTSYRFKDDSIWEAFIKRLTESPGLPTQEEINILFQGKVLPETEWINFLDRNDNAVSLHANNANALQLGEGLIELKSKSMGTPLFDLTPTFRMISTDVPDESLLATAREHFSHEVKKIHCLKKLSIKTKIIITTNQNFDKGLINGNLAEVISIAYKHKNDTSTLTQDAYVTTPLSDPDMIPWSMKVRVLSTNTVVSLYPQEDVKYLSSGAQYAIKYFPIMPASSFTAHKAQGKTIYAKTLIDVRNIFQEGQLYVMITRVTGLHLIFLTQMPTPEMFTIRPIVDKA